MTNLTYYHNFYEVSESILVLIKSVLFLCLQLRMDKTKEEFVRFIRYATSDNKTDAFGELSNFLTRCFVRADTDFDGKVFIDQFDGLIEEAAALPRKYGFAPPASEMYPTAEARKAARAQMFRDMNFQNDGFITLVEWIDYSVKHIMGKARGLPKDYLEGDCTKEEFITFIKKAVKKSNPEFKELYFFLLAVFTDADTNHDGAVSHRGFDIMIEKAAAAPRKHGLAPPTSTMFKTDSERIAKRLEYFKEMDSNNDDSISFDEWLNYAMTHIMGKVAALK